jgi:cell division protein FtsI (penicillin-binding protein 3)
MNAWVSTRLFGFSVYHAHGKRADAMEWSAGQAVLKKTRTRMNFTTMLFIVAYGLVAARMTHLTLTRPNFSEGEEKVATAAQSAVSVRRGDILDRNGMLLATSLKTSSLYADPKMILDPVEAAQKLSRVFPELPYGDLLTKFKSGKRFIWLKRHLTPKQVYMANSLGIPGIDFLDESRRLYPQGGLTAHVLGYTDIDRKGLAGMERGMEEVLQADREPLETTLDLRIQHILVKHVEKAIKDFSAIGGGGLVMDAKTGEIYAMASLPDFNPNDPDAVKPELRFNRMTQGAYEMGSTFKTFTTAAMLDRTDTKLMTWFDARAPLKRAGFTIRDFHPEKRYMSMPEVYVTSSNIGTALMAERIGTDVFRNFLGDLGLLEKSQIEIKENAAPLIPRPWREINTLTASYGHGIAVTPLQLVSATAAIVNGGVRVTPTLIKRPAEYYQSQEQNRVVSEETSATMRKLMRLVVTDGTAKFADAAGYRVGGKTGTAEKTLGRGYSQNAQIASFVGVFPMEAPRFVVLVMVDEPKPNANSYGYATAGWVAAPAVGHIVKEMAPLVGITPQRDTGLSQLRTAMGIGNEHQQGGRLASY